MSQVESALLIPQTRSNWFWIVGSIVISSRTHAPMSLSVVIEEEDEDRDRDRES